MTQYTIEQIKELLAKVTPGKWSSQKHTILYEIDLDTFGIILSPTQSPVKEDLEFIAQSKEIIQWLLDKNEKLEKENKSWMDDRDIWLARFKKLQNEGKEIIYAMEKEMADEKLRLQATFEELKYETEAGKDAELRFQAARNLVIRSQFLDPDKEIAAEIKRLKDNK